MSVKEWRAEIDQLDQTIIEALGKRVTLARQIARVKKEQRLPILDETREEEIRSGVKKLAKAHGLSPLIVVEIIQMILDYSRIEMGAV
ncbi:MAG: chorismate mutase [Verrucomicrobia bacterium]|nr:chorismate mutase [Verrucomicrobiota bacterium]MBU6446697.1 chorismate mutase [Verrucomicrobiota bacterium]MDE3047924.1 chorismate mutase [Verrucomicrobiota bacterium]